MNKKNIKEKNEISKSNENEIHPHKYFLSSAMASLSKVLIVQPFDFLRYRVQSNYNNTLKITTIFKNMLSFEGMKVFSKALSATTSGIFISSFSVFYFYQQGKDLMRENLKFLNPERTSNNLEYLHIDTLNSGLGGIYAGFFTAIIGLPTDVIRIRIQASQNIKKIENKTYNLNNPRECISHTYKQYGIKGFYTAGSVAILRECFAGFFYFGVFEYLKMNKLLKERKLKRNNNIKKLSNYFNFLFGSISGAINWCVTLPIDHIKTKLISDKILPIEEHKYKNTLDCVKQTYKNFGFTGFYKGISLIILRATLVNGVTMTVFEICNKE